MPTSGWSGEHHQPVRTALVVAGRDVRATFGSPFGFGLAAGYLAVSGLLLVLALRAGEARLDGWFAPLFLLTAVLCALLTMRSFADEERTGSLELLLTAPVRPTHVVIGKVLGAVSVLVIVAALTVTAPIVVAVLGNPDAGPIVTGYLGLLALGVLCCAVGVAASAATSSQLVAGATSGGLLLALWFAASVASILPGTAAAALTYASPSTHVTGFLRGTISLSDVVSFVSVAALAVAIAAVVVRARRGRRGAAMAARIVALIAVVVAMNVVVARSSAQVDLSADRRFTLAADTRDVVRSVAAPMKITAFLYERGGDARDARFLLERYHELNDRIDYDVIDPDERPGEARRYGISGYSTVVVEYQGRRVDAPEVSELQLSSAILRAVRGTTRTACALTGHGEQRFDDDGKSGLSSLRDLLTDNGYTIAPVDLTGGGAVPASCQVVLELGPTVPLRDAEVAAVRTYAANAGRLLVFGDTQLDSDADLNPLVEPWGISISNAVLLDPDRSVQGDPFGIVVQDFPTTNPIVRGVPSIQLTLATGLLGQSDEANGLTVSTLAQTSKAGFLDADGNFSPSSPDIGGPIPVAVAADASKVESSGETRVGGDGARIVRTRVVAVGNSHFVENEFLGSLGNRRFVVNAMGWLAEDEQLLTVSTAPPQPRELPWTAERQRTVVAVAVIGVPSAVVALGVVVLVVGRRVRPATRSARRAQDRKKRR
jgi:ABC-2 type transport system permease protein